MDSPRPQSYREQLQEKIVDTMILAIEKEEITEETMSEISAYVLDRIDTVTDKNTAIPFLKNLSEQWDIFKPILQVEESEIKEKMEDKATQDVLALLEHGKIDSAIELAKSVTHQSNAQ